MHYGYFLTSDIKLTADANRQWAGSKNENLLEECFSFKAGDAPRRASGAVKRDGKKPLSLHVTQR